MKGRWGMKKLLVLVISIIFVVSVTGLAPAADMPVKDEGVSTKKAAPTKTIAPRRTPTKAAPVKPAPLKTAAYKVGPIQKLERGVSNAAFGWTEIPKRIVDKTREYHNPIIGFMLGTFQGGCKAFARTASGISEVVTFPIGRYDKPRVLPDMPAV